jgi:non-specific serine/threonine protein kinase
MRGAIAWSHALLSPEAQLLFRRLSVFIGGFTLDGAAAVGALAPKRDPADDLALVRRLAALVDASLVQQAGDDGGARRYVMIETVREFAREQLATSGEQQAAEEARTRFILDLVETGEPHFLGPNEMAWQTRLNEELGNIRAALGWATVHEPEIASRIASALWHYWFWQGLIREGLAWLATGGASAFEPALRAKGLTVAAAMRLVQGDGAGGEGLAAEAVALAARLEDPIMEMRAWYVRAGAALLQGRLDDAAAQWDRAIDQVAAATSSSDHALGAYARACRGLVKALLGDPDAAVAFYEEALAEARRSGSGLIALLTLDDFAGLLLDAGNIVRARTLASEALRFAVHGGVVWPVGHVLFVLAAVDLHEGHLRLAALRLGAAEELLARSGVMLVPPLQQRIDHTTAMLAARLGVTGLARVRAQGRADPVAVIAQALASDDPGAGEPSGRSEHAVAPLSEREFQILGLLAQGLTDREIAGALHISRKTVSNHIASIRAKLGVKTRTAAAAIAMAAQLV